MKYALLLLSSKQTYLNSNSIVRIVIRMSHIRQLNNVQARGIFNHCISNIVVS